jgi:phage shock protein A
MLLAIAFTYILVYGGSQNIRSGPDVSLDVALAKRDQYGGDFLWFKKDGHRYLIRDAATLARVQALFERARVYKPESKRVKGEARSLERRESQLDREIDELTDRDEGPPLTAAEEDHLRDLRRELESVEGQLRVLERQEEEIDRKRDALEAEAEKQLGPILDEAIRSGAAAEVH